MAALKQASREGSGRRVVYVFPAGNTSTLTQEPFQNDQVLVERPYGIIRISPRLADGTNKPFNAVNELTQPLAVFRSNSCQSGGQSGSGRERQVPDGTAWHPLNLTLSPP